MSITTKRQQLFCQSQNYTSTLSSKSSSTTSI